MNYFLLYLLLINAAAFLLMLADKYKAKHHRWRIPESRLFLAAILGGSVGSLAGMYAVRHKTRHKTFTIGMPCILAVQILIGVFVYFHFFA